MLACGGVWGVRGAPRAGEPRRCRAAMLEWHGGVGRGGEGCPTPRSPAGRQEARPAPQRLRHAAGGSSSARSTEGWAGSLGPG